MITVMVHATVKQELLEEYLELIKRLSKETTKKGCISYSFNQNREDPTDFVLYEQWQSQTDLETHISELFMLLGPARPGDLVPEQLMKLYQKAAAVFYDVIE